MSDTKKQRKLNLTLRAAKHEDFYYLDEKGEKRYREGLPMFVDINDGKFRIELFGTKKAKVNYFNAVFEEGRVYLVENEDGVGGILS